jgi:hypothetical protein
VKDFLDPLWFLTLPPCSPFPNTRLKDALIKYIWKGGENQRGGKAPPQSLSPSQTANGRALKIYRFERGIKGVSIIIQP